jgi:hypothetical protein
MKHFKFLSWKVLIPVFVLFIVLSLILNYNIGFTKEAAKDKVLRDNIDLSGQAQYRYGYNNASQTELIIRAHLDNPLMYAGLLSSKLNNLSGQYLSPRININTGLNLLNEITKKEANLDLIGSCNTLLGYGIEFGKLNDVQLLLSQGNSNNKSNCELEYAIKSEKKEVIELLISKDYKLTEAQTMKLLTGCYTALVYTNIITDINQIANCNNRQLLDSYIKKISIGDRNIALKTAFENKYTLLIDVLLDNNADLSLLNLSNSEILNKALELKSDGLLVRLIKDKYPIPNNISYSINNNNYLHDVFVFAVNNNLNKSAIELLINGYNPASKYKPELNSSNDYPVIFSTVGSANLPMFNLLSQKYNAFNSLNQLEKDKLLAFAVDTFEYKADKTSLDILKSVVDSGTNLNSNLIYLSSDNYTTKEYPVWSQVYIKNLDIYPATVMDSRKVISNEYFDFIKEKNINLNFKSGPYTAMYLALTARSKTFVEYLFDKTNFNIQSKIKDDEAYDGISKIISNNDLELLEYIAQKRPDFNKITANDNYITSTLINPNLDKNKIIKVLIANGADPKLCPSSNRCPKDLVSIGVLEESIFLKF